MCVCVCVFVFVFERVCTKRKLVPDEWRERQTTYTILKVSSSKHNVRKKTTKCKDADLIYLSQPSLGAIAKVHKSQVTKEIAGPAGGGGGGGWGLGWGGVGWGWVGWGGVGDGWGVS